MACELSQLRSHCVVSLCGLTVWPHVLPFPRSDSGKHVGPFFYNTDFKDGWDYIKISGRIPFSGERRKQKYTGNSVTAYGRFSLSLSL